MTTTKTHYIFGILGLLLGLLIAWIFLITSYNDTPYLHAFDDLRVQREHHWQPYPTPDGNKQIGSFRQKLAFANLMLFNKGKSHFIVHEHESALKYDTGFWPAFTKNHNVKPGFEWVIGLYPEVCREQLSDNSNPVPRISIFMIPTLRDTANHKHAIDYFDAITGCDSIYYKLKTPGAGLSAKGEEDPNEYIYDQGTIFP